MADTCPVVQIAVPTAPGGFVEINATDYDPKIHKLYVEPAAKVEKPAPAKPQTVK